MATVGELYEEVDAKTISQRVRIAGRLLPDDVSVTWEFEFGQAPTATIVMPGAPPAYAVRAAPVTIDVGFNNLLVRVFTGTIEAPTREATETIIECVGMTRWLEVPYERTISVTMVGDASDLVEDILDEAGVTDYVVDLPTWAVGAAVQQTLEFQSYGEAVMKVAEVDGSPWFEMPSGQTRVEVRDPLPAPSAFRTYFSGVLTGVVETQPAGVTNADARPRIRDGQSRVKPADTKNQINVRGAIIDTVGPEGETNSDEIETQCDGPSPFIPTPPEFQGFVLSNELLDTPAKAGSTCARYFALLNRLETRVRLTIDGDPELFLGETVEVIDPTYTGVTGNWFLYGYRCRLKEGHFDSRLDLRGGGPGAGTSPYMDPFADFTWSGGPETRGGPGGGKIQQVTETGGGGAGAVMIIITFDGSASYDFDGTIVTYAWADDDGNAGNGRAITFEYDPTLVTTIEMTLTVTDNDGRTDSVTKTVTINDPTDPTADDTEEGGGPILLPTIYCAAGNTAMGSTDGGENWNDLAPGGAGAAGSFISVSGNINQDTGERIAVFGTTAGELVRTNDVCVTGTLVFTAPGGPRIEHVWKDIILADIWWASSADGRILRSADDGASWSQFHNFGDGFPVYRVATPGDGSLYAFGGDTSDINTLIRRDASKTGAFVPIIITGALATAVAAAGGGAAIQEAASRELDDLAVIFNGGVAPVHWFNTNIWTSDGWSAAVGLPAGTGEALAPGFDGAGELVGIISVLNSYYATDGITFAIQGAAPSQIAHLFWEPGMKCVYIGAAAGGIVKTIDCGVAWGYVRPNAGVGTVWPGGAVGYMVSFEAAPIEAADGDLYAITDIPDHQRLLAGNAWSVRDGAPPDPQPRNLRYFGNGLMFYCSDSTANDGNGDLRRSTDYGETWATLAVPGDQLVDAIIDVAMAPGGLLWGLWVDNGTAPVYTGRVYYSDDDGDTWTLSTSLTANMRMYYIVAHPTSDDIITVICQFTVTRMGTATTQDGGTTWSAIQDARAAAALQFGDQGTAVWTPYDRLIICFTELGHTLIRYSDDYGATWTTVVDEAITDRWGQIVRAGLYGPYFASKLATTDTYGVFRSLDQAVTWESCEVPGAGTAAQETLGYSLTYDILTDSLYLGGQSDAPYVYRLPLASTVDMTAPGWENLPAPQGGAFIAVHGVVFIGD